MTNKICSMFDPVIEVYIKVQGEKNAYISEATFITNERLEDMNEQEVRIRVPDKPEVDPVPYEEVEVREHQPKMRKAIKPFREMISAKQLGEVHSAVEHISTLLRKCMSNEECVNGSNDTKSLTIDDVKRLGNLFSDSVVPPPSPAPGPAPGPALASALAPASAPDANELFT